MAELLKTKSMTDSTAVPLVDPMEALRAKEATLLQERLDLLEAENAALRSRKTSSQVDPRRAAIAAQMANLEDAPKKGITHISEFEKAGVEYKGKEEDLLNLEAAREG